MPNLKLQTYNECYNNIALFTSINKASCNTVLKGQFVEYNKNLEPIVFEWYEDGTHHRLDGPAIITENNAVWMFLGEWIIVNNQVEFEKYIYNVTGKM